MSSNISKILIIGATSGIGEGFATRLHAQGKKIIITGRRQDRLNKIKSSLTGGTPVETLTWDVSDLAAIPNTVSSILKSHPDLDTVYVNAGIQLQPSLLDSSTSSDSSIINEITTNQTALFLIARAFIPYLSSRASQGKHAAFMATSSGLAITPMPLFPVYCATKAAVHSFMVSLRQQIAKSEDSNVVKFLSICEIAPPYVDTELDAGKRSTGLTPMPLKEYLDETFKQFDEGDGQTGKLKREIGAGTSTTRFEAWRGSVGAVLEKMGMKE